jgi:hypothetical protein
MRRSRALLDEARQPLSLIADSPVLRDEALAIYRKLGVSSRGEAVARARALGLVADGPS